MKEILKNHVKENAFFYPFLNRDEEVKKKSVLYMKIIKKQT